MPHSFFIKTKSVEFALDPNRGCQWETLRFKIPSENQTEESFSEWVDVLYGFNRLESFFGSGCFIMFPWVNRMLPNSFYPNDSIEKDSTPNRYQLDANSLPLHGTIHQDSWKKVEGSNRLELTYQEFSGKRKCNLSQEFEMGESELKVNLQINNLFPESWKYSVGYHPYFRLPLGTVDDWILQFYGEGERLELDSRCLPILVRDGSGEKMDSSQAKFPVVPFPLKNVQLDDLYFFNDGIRISLTHPQLNYSIWIESIGNLDTIFNYCQIYTDPSRDRIAIEPMVTPGNFENIPIQFNNILQANGKKKSSFCIKIKSN